MNNPFSSNPTPETIAFEDRRRTEMLDEAFAYFFDYEYVTPEQGYADIKNAVKGWRDYYTKFVDKADKLLQLLEQADEGTNPSSSR